MISKKAEKRLAQGSRIRAMFEEAKKLRALLGDENVFDFSLGNPDQKPPQEILNSLLELAELKADLSHSYMSNAGYTDLRGQIAEKEMKRNSRTFAEAGVIMTVGAAGALNVCLQTILNPDDEVIIIAPYFAEYIHYIDQANAKAVVCPSLENFLPDLERLEALCNERTKAIIINSPNNPSGAVYPESLYQKLQEILSGKNQTIYVLSDEVYRDILYTDADFPSPAKAIENTMICYSWSKSYSIPGERVGYIACSKDVEGYETLVQALALYNRTLGFVNAPAIWQNVLRDNVNIVPDTSVYRRKRDLFLDMFRDLRVPCHEAEGAFYLFPKVAPQMTSDEYVAALKQEGILVVAGEAFGYPGHVRISYAVPMEKIEQALPKYRAFIRRVYESDSEK